MPVPVAFVSSHALGGGSERYLELLLEALGPAWSAGLVSLAHGPFVDRMRDRGHDVTVIPTSARAGIVTAAVRLRHVLKARSPAVIHANGVKAALVARIAAAGTGVPVVWVKHDFSWDGALAKLLAWRCARVVAVSGAVTTTFGTRLRSKVAVVPNGLPDVARERPPRKERLLAELGAPAGSAVAVLVGRLHQAKGQLELVESAERLLGRLPEARLALIGGDDPTQPEYARSVRRRVADLGLDKTIALLGHREDVLDLLAGADACVLPSVPDERGAGREACPFALLEAMSVGTPVVAYADGGVPEALGDAGRLVPAGDRSALADALADVLRREDVREDLARRARRRVLARNSLDGMVEAMKRCYEELAGV